MLNPVAVLIDKALNYINNKDPSWEEAQPAEFRVRVIESWKRSISSRFETNCRILWELPVGDQTFQCRAPLFCQLDWNYNPYVLGMHKPHLLARLK